VGCPVAALIKAASPPTARSDFLATLFLIAIPEGNF
jgi:hypothetical protein